MLRSHLHNVRVLAGWIMEKRSEIFDLYIDYLASSFGPTTGTGLARVLEGSISHDQATRMLAEREPTASDLWRWVKPQVRRIQSAEALLLFDDSISLKPYTDESELVTWHFDHSQNRSVKGINFISALYHSQGATLPVSFEVVTKPAWEKDPKTGRNRRRAVETKNERYRRMLRACVANQLPFEYVVNDVWYGSVENMSLIHEELQKHFVMPLKSNRLVALSEKDKKAGRYVRLDRLTWREGQLRRVWLKGLDFPVQALRQVFKNEDGSEGILYLCSDDLALSAERICDLYKKRWKCEEYHKSLKQNASLSKAPVQRLTSQVTHLFASLCAYVRLETIKMKTSLNHFALKSKLYLKALQQSFAAFQHMQN
jgi:DDE superfamily endonuclease